MSKVLITGAADGLGREAAKQLVHGGHDVVLHARDEARAEQALAGVPGRRQRSRATSPRSRALERWPI
jgi:short-subunit dehydrogenase